MPETSVHLMSHPFEDFFSSMNLQLADCTVTEIFQVDVRIRDWRR